MEKENQEVEENLELPEEKEGEEDTTDWKAEAQKLQQKAIKQREATKRLKDELKAKTAPKEEAPKENKSPSSELDYGQKAYLNSYGIKGPDELALVKTWLARTGDDLDSIVTDDIFTAKLNALREAKASQQAIPSGTKRAGNTTKDSADYWLAKYESGTPLTDIPDDLRNTVLNQKTAKDKGSGSGKFASKSVVLG